MFKDIYKGENMEPSNPTSLPTTPIEEISIQAQDCVSIEDASLPAALIITEQIHEALQHDNSLPVYIP
jgi:hypothetical protein